MLIQRELKREVMDVVGTTGDGGTNRLEKGVLNVFINKVELRELYVTLINLNLFYLN